MKRSLKRHDDQSNKTNEDTVSGQTGTMHLNTINPTNSKTKGEVIRQRAMAFVSANMTF
jgi:hypothetical protein